MVAKIWALYAGSPGSLHYVILGNLLFHFVPLLSHELKLPHRFFFFFLVKIK